MKGLLRMKEMWKRKKKNDETEDKREMRKEVIKVRRQKTEIRKPMIKMR